MCVCVCVFVCVHVCICEKAVFLIENTKAYDHLDE